MKTFGPAYQKELDFNRLTKQMDRVRCALSAAEWLTLSEVAWITGDPESSISAQIRHLRKPRFGNHTIEKRRRLPHGGTWEYRLVS